MLDDEKAALLKQAGETYSRGAFQRAREIWNNILEEDPANTDALAGYVNSSMQLSDTGRCSELARRAFEIAPGEQKLVNIYLDTLITDKSLQAAIDFAVEQLKKFPGSTNLHVKIAHCRMGFGELEEARADLWAAHESDAEAVSPLYFLVRMGDKRDFEELAPKVDRVWAKKDDFETSDQIMLCYTQATLSEKLGQYDKAWAAYTAGNDLQSQLLLFDEAGFIETMNKNMKMFSKNAPPPAKESDPGGDLIFIVSLPRSGSTLTEQILGSHSKVWPIGERALVLESFNIWSAAPGREALEKARTHYRKAAYEIAGREIGEDIIISDKTINNYFFVGFLRTLFPAAKFVHVVRSPLDAAISCYATPFGLNALQWCCDLETIGRTFRRYQRAMKSWMRTERGDLFTFSYERLTAAPEKTARELIAFCGLEWEPGCLDFHKSKAQVSTASLVQVRQPIYQSAKGRSENFEAHLAPLKQVMGRAASLDWYK